MAIQTFVADTILTAAQMNALQGNDYNQTVSTKTASYTLVAADKGTKIVMNSASATTITVNTSLFSAGDTLTILNIAAGVCTVTAGTATVSTTGSLALAQNGGGTLYFTSAGVSVFQADGVTASAGGLTLISSTTIGTTVSSVTVSNAFSATYENYKIIISGGVGSSSDTNILLTLGSTTTNYYEALVGYTFAGSASSTNTNSGASFTRAASVFSTSLLFANIDILNPNLAKRTIINYYQILTTLGRAGIGVLDNATQYTDFTFTPLAGTLTGGTIRVYGYSNSQDYMTHKIQIDGLVRDATADEAAQIDAQRDAQNAKAKAEVEATIAKNAAQQAVLDKLGLTADEAQALLG